MADAWTDAENDLIVSDYLTMLAKELRGEPFSKTGHRRRLRQQIERTEGSIEYKHQNVSAALKSLGEDWIAGYKPAFNFQMSLVDAIVRQMAKDPVWSAPVSRNAKTAFGLHEAAELWIGPPPALRNEPEPKELEQTRAIARKFNVAERDERNRALGRAGEELVLKHEIQSLSNAGRHDLARKVSWTSDIAGDGAGYDIASYAADGRERLIEVKTTNGWERTPFHISRNELRVADECRESWVLLRVHSFSRSPKAFEIYPPLERHVELTPTSFQATFM